MGGIGQYAVTAGVVGGLQIYVSLLRMQRARAFYRYLNEGVGVTECLPVFKGFEQHGLFRLLFDNGFKQFPTHLLGNFT